MSNSRRKTNITGITRAESEKQDKILAHRRMRRAVRGKLRPYLVAKLGGDVENTLPLPREVSNVYSFAKDGKQRFNPSKYPELMRK